MKRVCCLLLSITILLSTAACSKQMEVTTWLEQYDLGVRYLSEGNYQEAIIAFTAAIEIDPKRAPAYVGRGDTYMLSEETEENLSAARIDYEKAIELDEISAEAYLGLADVYIRQGDYEKAKRLLVQGLKMTEGNQRISDKIVEVENPLLTDELFQEKDLTVFGIPIYELDIQEGAELLQTEYPQRHIIGEYDDQYSYVVTKEKPDIEDTTFIIIEIYQDFNSDCLTGVTYCAWSNYEGSSSLFKIETGIRGISTGESTEDVLRKLGFSEKGTNEFSDATGEFFVNGKEVIENMQNSQIEGLRIYFVFDKYCSEFMFMNGKLDQLTISLKQDKWFMADS